MEYAYKHVSFLCDPYGFCSQVAVHATMHITQIYCCYMKDRWSTLPVHTTEKTCELVHDLL